MRSKKHPEKYDIGQFAKMRPHTNYYQVSKRFLDTLLSWVEQGKTTYQTEDLKNLGWSPKDLALLSRFFSSANSAKLVEHVKIDEAQKTNSQKKRGDTHLKSTYQVVGNIKVPKAPKDYCFYPYWLVFNQPAQANIPNPEADAGENPEIPQ